MILFSRIGQMKRRERLLVFYLGLSLILIGCTRTPSQDASSSPDASPVPGQGDAVIFEDEDTLDNAAENEESKATDSTVAEITKETEEGNSETSRRFLRPSTTSSQAHSITQTEDESPVAGQMPIPIVTDEPLDPWSLQELSYISEMIISEINLGRQGASLDPLAWDNELAGASQNKLETDYALQTYEGLGTQHYSGGYLIYFSSEIQLGDTEMENRFIELLQSDNSLRAGLFDDRFTRVGVASALSIRPEESPSYVYLCYINPAGAPLSPVTTEEPIESTELVGTSEFTSSGEPVDYRESAKRPESERSVLHVNGGEVNSPELSIKKMESP